MQKSRLKRADFDDEIAPKLLYASEDDRLRLAGLRAVQHVERRGVDVRLSPAAANAPQPLPALLTRRFSILDKDGILLSFFTGTA